MSVGRGFPKIDHSGSSARIVLQQNKFIKELPLTGIEPGTLARTLVALLAVPTSSSNQWSVVDHEFSVFQMHTSTS